MLLVHVVSISVAVVVKHLPLVGIPGDELQYLIKWQEQLFEGLIWEDQCEGASQLYQD